MTTILHFEDFRAGQKFDLGTHKLTAEEIIAFAREFDPQPMHTDPEEAKKGMLGGLIASGWHLCALAMRMTVDNLFSRATSLGAPGVNAVQWRRPARVDDVLRLEGEVLETRASQSKPDSGFVRFRIAFFRGEERVMFFETPVMFGKRSV
jgi:acyl dehydratase